MTAPAPARPHVLVARLDNAGDVLLTGPAVRAVAAGARRVTYLAGPAGRAAAALLPGVDDVRVLEAPWVAYRPDPVDPIALTRFVDEVVELAVDRAIVHTSFHQSPLPLALLLRMAGVPHVAATSVDFPGALLDVRHLVDDDVHEVERGRSLAEAAGFPIPSGDDGRLAVRRAATAAAPDDVAAELARLGPHVVLHPGASVPARAWPVTRHAELAGLLVEAGWDVVVTGGPGERDLTATVAAGARGGGGGRVVDLGGRTDLAGLAAVLRGAAVVVVANTGPAHLAAAVGTPVVSLFSPVVPAARWRPWGVPHELLGDQAAPCTGSRARDCPVAGHPCLADVTAAAALAAVARLAGARAAHDPGGGSGSRAAR